VLHNQFFRMNPVPHGFWGKEEQVDEGSAEHGQ
jgi:hypothetical protein